MSLTRCPSGPVNVKHILKHTVSAVKKQRTELTHYDMIPSRKTAFIHSIRPVMGPTQLLFQCGYWGTFSWWVRWPRQNDDCSPTSSTKVIKVWSHMATHQTPLWRWCLIKHRLLIKGTDFTSSLSYLNLKKQWKVTFWDTRGGGRHKEEERKGGGEEASSH
jgi:hypothetical protein